MVLPSLLSRPYGYSTGLRVPEIDFVFPRLTHLTGEANHVYRIVWRVVLECRSCGLAPTMPSFLLGLIAPPFPSISGQLEGLLQIVHV